MSKKFLPIIALAAVSAVMIFGAANRSLANSTESTTSQDEYGFVNTQPGEPAELALPAQGELSSLEIDALLYMREEEKLAHDVYVTLYDRWGLPIFLNISRSELIHTNAIESLLDRYGLADPASSEIGVFTHPDLQALYDSLVTRGDQSLAEALKTGAAIEEIDILDLEENLGQIDNADIQQVFENLLQGSQNHLRAFVATLNAKTGETYQPQVLASEEFQRILSNPTGNGNAGRGGNSGGQGRRRQGQP
jgi:hypothetical protein